MATPTGSGASDSITNSADYQTLMTSIKSTIDKNDLLFKQIQQSNYPDAGKYTSDLINYKLDTQVTDLTAARKEIWDFLNKKYEENTKLRTYYFNEIRKAEEHIVELTSTQQDLIDSIESSKVSTSTLDKNIKNEKYYYNKMQYYLFLYKVLIFVQIAILLVFALCVTGIIPKTTCLVITIIILIATVAFVAYYVFFVNIGRSVFSWSKFDHDNTSNIKSKQCSNDKNAITDADKKKAQIDIAVSKIINDSKNIAQTCDS
jgi:hypothetical protein